MGPGSMSVPPKRVPLTPRNQSRDQNGGPERGALTRNPLARTRCLRRDASHDDRVILETFARIRVAKKKKKRYRRRAKMYELDNSRMSKRIIGRHYAAPGTRARVISTKFQLDVYGLVGRLAITSGRWTKRSLRKHRSLGISKEFRDVSSLCVTQAHPVFIEFSKFFFFKKSDRAVRRATPNFWQMRQK